MTAVKKTILLVALGTFLFPSVHLAETRRQDRGGFDSALQMKKTCLTRLIAADRISLDGQLDEAAWDEVDWHGDFIQREPYEGEKPTFDTRFKITYDNHNLYVAIRAFDNEPDKIVRRMSRRDDIDGDWVMVDIDSYYDQKTSFNFAVSAAGVREDGIITGDGSDMDQNWDPIWEAKTSVDKLGWMAEIKIPFSQLRFANSTDHTWGIQVTRYLHRKEERSNWQFIPRNASGWVHYFGKLKGLKDIQAGGKLELTPYTVGSLHRFEPDPQNPFTPAGRNLGLNFGLDGKYSITSDLTVDFTVNPDFGQVEADPSEINLTAYETFFQEKRPFFIEGKSIMDFTLMEGDGTFSNDNLFYSRRIGSRPSYDPEGDYVDAPRNTSILGAMKLTGKNKKGFSIGIMDSVTSPEAAELSLDGQLEELRVEPLTNYFLLRAQQDYDGGNTSLGGMLTAVNRRINDDHLDYLHDAAYSGGMDFLHRWKNKTYALTGRLVFSMVHGSEEAILETQQSSRRYFQRPDASHVAVDDSRRALYGYGGTFAFSKSGNGSLSYSTGVTFRSPGLELNDMGYLRQADMIMQWVWAGYSINNPFFIFRQVRFNFNEWLGWNFAGESRFGGGNFGIGGQFKNYWNFWISTNLNGKGISDSLLRGGPSFPLPGGQGYYLSLSTDNRKKFRLNFGCSTYQRKYGVSDSLGLSVGMTYQPTHTLSITLEPYVGFDQSSIQYVDTLEFQDQPRYLLASIDQITYRLTLRINYSISPRLTLQFYGQPFISSGEYHAFKRITHPGAADFVDRFAVFDAEAIHPNPMEETIGFDENEDGRPDYQVDNPDFNFLQFSSNLVLRWEYAPGSTLFLVWSQGRSGYYTEHDQHFGRNLDQMFGMYPDNVFLVKFTYRIR